MYIEKKPIESIRPLKNYVKVKIHIPEDIRSKGGLVIINNAKISKFFIGIEILEGEIIELSIGAGKLSKGVLKPGDKVIFDNLSGITIPTEGNDCIKLIDVSMLILKNTGNYEELNAKELTPNFDRVLVKLDPSAKKTSGGIILPGTQVSNFRDAGILCGKVISISHEIDDIVPGDQVVFDEFCGVPVQIGNEKYRIIVKYDIFAKISNIPSLQN